LAGGCALLLLSAVAVPAPKQSSGAGKDKAKQRAEPPAGHVALSAAPPQATLLLLPFEGAWGVLQGVDGKGTHSGYAAYALDFVPAEPGAAALTEADFRKRKRLADHPCYGRPVLASAAGRVLWARDGARELPPFRESKRHEAGNFVILEHRQDEFTEYRHLQRGSIAVKVGDQVAAGQVIGRCGNSGGALTPHLHFAMLGSIEPIATRPFRLSGYEVMTAPNAWQPGDGELKQGQIVRPVQPPAGAKPGP
jgi:murein DD-endopeptidase MepM/ murein hydrolase activator NlpD